MKKLRKIKGFNNSTRCVNRFAKFRNLNYKGLGYNYNSRSNNKLSKSKLI